jgi:peroxiredoxin
MKHLNLSLLGVFLSCVICNAGLAGRQSSDQQSFCTPEGCQIGGPAFVADSAGTNPKERLAFQLLDICGRQINSSDYAGVPVLFFFGSCWCGGCQSDAEPFRQLAAEYTDRGLVCVRVVAGDNELAAMDFQNHFRLPMVQLMDTDRAFETQYNPDGWTFLMLCDQQGTVVYTHHHFPDAGGEDWIKMKAAIDRVLSSPVKPRVLWRDGTPYMPATLERTGEDKSERLNERFASMACAPDGNLYLVSTAVRHDSCDVFLTSFDSANVIGVEIGFFGQPLLA